MGDDLSDDYLLNIEMVSQWSKNLVPFFTLGKLHLSKWLEGNLLHIKLMMNFVMLVRRLYKQGTDGVLRVCIESTDAERYLEFAHVAMGNIYFAPDQTLKCIERIGVCWQ